MSLKKDKIISSVISAFIILLLGLVIYGFSSHRIIIMGYDNKIYMTNITELDLRKNRLRRGEEEKLKYFKDLKYLNMRLVEINSIDFVNNMPDLEHFEFQSSLFRIGIMVPSDVDVNSLDIPMPEERQFDYTPLISAKKLKILRVLGSGNDDLSFLKQMPEIEYFQFDCSKLDEYQIECISSLKNLVELKLSSCFASTEFLANFKKLEHLALYECDIENANIEDFLNLSELEFFEISEMHIDNIGKLTELDNLKKVTIYHNKFSEEELKPLKEKNIEVIY